MKSPYTVWKQKFLDDNDCPEEEFGCSRVISASIPHFLSIFLFFSYVACGTFAFQYLDEAIAADPFYEALMFSFTTVTSIGYGKVVPQNPVSKMFCVVYCAIGIPMAYLAFSNIGEFLAEYYWIVVRSVAGNRKIEGCYYEKEHRLPLPVVSSIILIHSCIGGLIFHYWIDEMPIIPAIYFSFISITTIGFGDLNPTPDNAYHTIVLILYLSSGIVIMSTLFGALSGHLRDYSKCFFYLGAEEDEDDGEEATTTIATDRCTIHSTTPAPLEPILGALSGDRNAVSDEETKKSDNNERVCIQFLV